MTETVIDVSDTDPLQRALAANVVFSMVSGAVLAVAAGPLGAFAGVPVRLVLVTGLGALAFGASLAVPMWRSGISRRLAHMALVADGGWVVGAVALVMYPDAISTGGRWILGAMTLVVGGFGIAEWVGLRRAVS